MYLLCYAIVVFAYVYHQTGGATSVSMVDGEYVAKYKATTIRTISKSEYLAYPNLTVRVMSAWMCAMAAQALTALTAGSIESARLKSYRSLFSR